MCALVGLKPTRGRSSFGPGLGERWSGFSSEFAVTRSVRDAAALLDCVAGAMPGDPYSAAPPARPFRLAVGADPGRLRVGFLRRAPRGIEVHPDCAGGVQDVARALESLGHAVEESHPDALDDPAVAAHYVTVVACNTARALEAWGERVGRPVADADVEPLTWELAQRGGELPATRLLATLEWVHRYGRRLAAWWEGGFDLLLTPTQAQPPMRLGEIHSTRAEPLRALVLSAPYGVFTFPFNLSGQPAISVPARWTADGRPVGAQLVAPTGREDLLLGVAAQLETALGAAERRPPHHA
jgi:amidase